MEENTDTHYEESSDDNSYRDPHARYFTKISDDLWVEEDFNNPGGCGCIVMLIIFIILFIIKECTGMGILQLYESL